MPIVQKSIDSLGYQPVDERLIAEDIQALIEEVNILSEGGGNSDYTETIVNITSAQILNMGSTPIELLPAAGVGKYYDYYGFGEYLFNTAAYVFIGDSGFIGGLNSYFGQDLNNILGGNSGTFKFSSAGSILGKTEPQQNNESIVFTTYDSENPTLGDGTLRVKIYHKTITFGA